MRKCTPRTRMRTSSQEFYGAGLHVCLQRDAVVSAATGRGLRIQRLKTLDTRRDRAGGRNEGQ